MLVYDGKQNAVNVDQEATNLPGYILGGKMKPFEKCLWSLYEGSNNQLDHLMNLSLSCLKGKKRVHPGTESMPSSVVSVITRPLFETYFGSNLIYYFTEVVFNDGKLESTLPFFDLYHALILDLFAENKINFFRGNQINGAEDDKNDIKTAEQLIIDVSNAVINALQIMPKCKGKTRICIRINLFKDKYIGGSVFWGTSYEFVPAVQTQSGKKKRKKIKTCSNLKYTGVWAPVYSFWDDKRNEGL
jgi:hypothetical protein